MNGVWGRPPLCAFCSKVGFIQNNIIHSLLLLVTSMINIQNNIIHSHHLLIAPVTVGFIQNNIHTLSSLSYSSSWLHTKYYYQTSTSLPCLQLHLISLFVFCCNYYFAIEKCFL
uniref:Uncharacterized protein n=1 Tax=Cacopsylla melanoneura TaxID=428564 RepID=A0A8D8TCA0_9HEMI